MDDLKQFLAGVSCDVNARLDELIPAADVLPSKLHQAIRWSVFAGGKRFRPAILIAVGEAFGAGRASLRSTAAAVEMIHTYSLIHDDLPAMDDDDLRRGRATCHVEFGEATAILAGDVLQTLAFKAIADDSSLSAQTRVDLVSILAEASGTPNGMVAGQQLDLDAEGSESSIDEISGIHGRKTGALITASTEAGALIAGTDSGARKYVRAFGDKLGLLFQITDDLLDVTQETSVLGKTAGKDVSSQKATYPSHFGHAKTVEMVEAVRGEAMAELELFGNETGVLKRLVDFVVDRKS